ncbi:hypothetical protein MLD38_004743 [Melastoma candidum]|uniref:Uncharacterized protein n=1 Tax=Melastoma candidum TaxID=119954 RepID=A0ACB9S803_9MYRT|nr:hypothetical protein MLD38_004743 [Melastoma candidum]
MKADDMKLDTAAYTTILRSLCRSGRVAEPFEVFDYAVESISLTDVAAYSTPGEYTQVVEEGHGTRSCF